MSALVASMVDAVLDQLGEDEDPGDALATLLDQRGQWDWSSEDEHGPEERVAVIESSGAWWAVYAGADPAEAIRCASGEEATARVRDWRAEV